LTRSWRRNCTGGQGTGMALVEAAGYSHEPPHNCEEDQAKCGRYEPWRCYEFVDRPEQAAPPAATSVGPAEKKPDDHHDGENQKEGKTSLCVHGPNPAHGADEGEGHRRTPTTMGGCCRGSESQFSHTRASFKDPRADQDRAVPPKIFPLFRRV